MRAGGDDEVVRDHDQAADVQDREVLGLLVCRRARAATAARRLPRTGGPTRHAVLRCATRPNPSRSPRSRELSPTGGKRSRFPYRGAPQRSPRLTSSAETTTISAPRGRSSLRPRDHHPEPCRDDPARRRAQHAGDPPPVQHDHVDDLAIRTTEGINHRTAQWCVRPRDEDPLGCLHRRDGEDVCAAGRLEQLHAAMRPSRRRRGSLKPMRHCLAESASTSVEG